MFNVGARASNGSITVSDVLPPGVAAVEAGELINYGETNSGEAPAIGHELWRCTGAGGDPIEGASEVLCTNSPETLPSLAGGGGAPSKAEVGPNRQPIIGIVVSTGGPSAPQSNHVTISGGGAPTPAVAEDPVRVSASTPPFGFAGWDAWFSNADGTLDTQAGSHPYEATFDFDLAEALTRNKAGEVIGAHPAGGEARNIEVQLPPGIVGNPTAVAQCTRPQLDVEKCPTESQIGTATAYFAEFGEAGFRVFNMVPPPGVAAEFGFNFQGILTLLDSTARTGRDYGITTHVNQLAQREVVDSVVTLWGVPGEASHNIWRIGRVGGCTQEQTESTSAEEGRCANAPKPSSKPFLMLPTSCTDPRLSRSARRPGRNR